MRLSPLTEATAGRFDLTRRPYWRYVLDAFDDPEITDITIMASTQLGKTLSCLVAALLALAAQAAAPALAVTPDKESAIELRDRVYENMKTTPCLRRNVAPRRLWNTRHIDLGSMRCYLGYAGARQRLRGRPCRYVFLSEIDVYRGDAKGGNPVAAARERVKAFRRFKFLRESSPMGENSEIGAAYEASNKCTLRCRCPHCGTYQELRFFAYTLGDLAGRGGIAGWQDDTGTLREPEEAAALAHYVCVNGCRIDNSQKSALIESGVMVPAGCEVDGAGNVTGTPRRGKKHTGVHLWSIHSETISFGDLAAAYLAHRRDGKLPEFFGNWLGLPFTARQKLPQWEVLGRRLAAHHVRFQVPEAAWFATCGADTQEDRVYFVVRAWGDKCSSWLVDWGELPRQPGDDADEIKSDLLQLVGRVLQARYQVVDSSNRPALNPLGRGQMLVRLAGIDSNYRTLDVHNFVRRQKSDRLRNVRGDHQVNPGQKYRMTVIDRSPNTGQVYAGGLHLWGIYVNHFKQDLQTRFMATGKERTWFVTNDCLAKGKDYLRQLVNEPKQVETDKRGRRRLVFKPRSNVIGVDYWDCEVYARALAEMIVDSFPGQPGWDARYWPKPRPPQISRPEPLFVRD